MAAVALVTMSASKGTDVRLWLDPAIVKEISADLAPEIDELSAEIADAIRAALPQAVDDPGTVAEIRSASRAALDYFVTVVEEGADLRSIRVPSETERWVRHFARQGVELADFLHAVRIGHALFWGRWLTALRAHFHEPDALADAIEQVSRQQFTYADAMATEMAAVHADEREQWVRSAASIRVDTMQRILDEVPIDIDEASARLGYDLRRDHIGFVLWAEEDADVAAGDLSGAAQAIAASVGEGRALLVERNTYVVAGWLGGNPAPALEDVSSTVVSEAARNRYYLAIGTTGSGVGGFRRSHIEAMHARRVAQLGRRRPGSVTRYSKVALASLASADLEEARWLVQRELGPLAGDEDDMLRIAATLRVYFEEGSSLERAARRLGVHKNTVNNRVRRARELLGTSLDERPLEVQVALVLSRLVRD
jgi:DNA-binding PucR family transcriptional regulator